MIAVHTAITGMMMAPQVTTVLLLYNTLASHWHLETNSRKTTGSFLISTLQGSHTKLACCCTSIMPVTGQVIKKVVQKLKRTDEDWYFDAPPEMFKRFHLLLELAFVFKIDYSHLNSFYNFFWGFGDWEEFQNKIELKLGYIDNDSCTTLATIDDNPGAGRILDKIFYQPIGKSIERLFLNLELRYFHPPEKSARRIKRFLEGSTFFGSCIPVDKLADEQLGDFTDDVEKPRQCVELFAAIGRDQKIAKAFQILLAQAR